MKLKSITLFCIFMLIASTALGAISTDGGVMKDPSGGVFINTDCNQSQYYPIGVLCQDTDDGILYKGTGSAVVAVSPAATATALAANGANCSSGQAPLGVDASGAVESCFAVQASNANLTAIAGLTFADVSIIQLTGAGAGSVLTCTASQLIGANATGNALECKSTVNIRDFNISIQAGDGTYSGLTINYTAGETLAFGQPVYVKSDGKVWKADADGAATMPAVGLVVVGGNADATVTILVHGYITETDWNWTIGNTIYVADGDAGAITATLADISDENDVVQIIGIAVHADSIYVSPSLATVVLAAP